jgi:hypothetical protein
MIHGLNGHGAVVTLLPQPQAVGVELLLTPSFAALTRGIAAVDCQLSPQMARAKFVAMGQCRLLGRQAGIGKGNDDVEVA